VNVKEDRLSRWRRDPVEQLRAQADAAAEQLVPIKVEEGDRNIAASSGMTRSSLRRKTIVALSPAATCSVASWRATL
jgi:hypothetical protein